MRILIYLIIFFSSMGFKGFDQVIDKIIPKNYGIDRDIKFYTDKLKNEKLLKTTPRIKNFVSACREELRLKKNCVHHDELTFPCSDTVYLTSGEINYCTEVKKENIVISKRIGLDFENGSKHNTAISPEAKIMFYSAVKCMKAVYLEYGIELDLEFYETNKPKNTDILVYDEMSGDPNLHFIPTGHIYELYSHSKLCYLVTHEFSHHFALPDRYEFKKDGGCPLLPVAPPGQSVMSSKIEMGYKGLSFMEEDLFTMLGPSCPNTLRGYEEYKNAICPPPIINDIMDEEQNIFIKKIKEVLRFFD